MPPSQQQPVISNATSNVTTPTRTLYDPTAGDTLFSNLNSAFDNSSQSQGILDRYNSAQGATAANTKQTGQYLQDMYGQNVDFTKLQNNVEQGSSLEGRTGFATNIAALTNLQAQGAQRVKALTDQANQALMANNAQGAQALSDLAVQEQQALTTARTNFLSNYFGSQQEARSQASFQTPEQSSVMDLAKQYPGAGITSADTLDVASQKITSSPLYQANLGEVQQNIATAKAQAGLAGAQAGLTAAQTGVVGQEANAQTLSAQAAAASAAASQSQAASAAELAGPQAQYQRTLNNFIGNGTTSSSDPDVQSLLNNTATPQEIQTKYPVGTFGGKAQSIISAAQSAGYNLQTGTNAGVAAQTNAQNLGAGGYTGASTAATNWLSTFLGAGFGTTSNNSTANQLSEYLNPKQGQTTTLNGKTYSFNGQSWVPQ